MNLPKLENLNDVRKYLMIIESLELNKLNNAISVNARLSGQVKGVQDLKTIKNYYGDLTEFLIQKQSENRMDECEDALVQQIEEFLQFWQEVMEDFKKLSASEIDNAIEKNESLKNELNEMLEKTLGFKAPPNGLFLNLLHIRKIASKLKDNDSNQFLNFDYFKKHNIKVNQDWIRDRKIIITTRLEQFEKRLEVYLEMTKHKLNLELDKLHSKRLQQYDKLMVRYNKVKMTVASINSKEIYEVRKLKADFLARSDLPTYYHSNDLFLNGIQNGAKFQKQDERILPDYVEEDEEEVTSGKFSKGKAKGEINAKGVRKVSAVSNENKKNKSKGKRDLSKNLYDSQTNKPASSYDLCKEENKKGTQVGGGNKTGNGGQKKAVLKGV